MAPPRPQEDLPEAGNGPEPVATRATDLADHRDHSAVVLGDRDHDLGDLRVEDAVALTELRRELRRRSVRRWNGSDERQAEIPRGIHRSVSTQIAASQHLEVHDVLGTESILVRDRGFVWPGLPDRGFCGLGPDRRRQRQDEK